jgi:hypothetical protein
MKTKISVYFTLTDFEIEPDQITTLLGISPYKAWKVGDLARPNTKIREKENGWQLKSNPENSDELESHISSLLEYLKPKWKELIEITNNCYTELSCVIYIEDEIPSIHFDQKIIQQLSELKAEIDVDLYDFTED